MKVSLLSVICCLFLISCGQKSLEIPEILKSHPERASFTKLDDPNNQPIVLFNGKDLTNFYTYNTSKGKNNDVEQNYKVQDGVLFFSGPEAGYLATNESFKNYYFKVQFRWGETKYRPRLNDERDSGIIFHFTEDRVWPTSFEFQVMEGSTGDSWLTGPVTCTDSKGTAYPLNDEMRILKYKDAEKASGEWNLLEMLCYENHAEFFVNGVKVNDIHDLSLTEGRILLQLEYADVYYKDIELIQLY